VPANRRTGGNGPEHPGTTVLARESEGAVAGFMPP
jgi:hypothetical protein